jgi:hypothetical protein
MQFQILKITATKNVEPRKYALQLSNCKVFLLKGSDSIFLKQKNMLYLINLNSNLISFLGKVEVKMLNQNQNILNILNQRRQE